MSGLPGPFINSYDKGTPVARPVRKAKDLTRRQPGSRRGRSGFHPITFYDREHSMKSKAVSRLALITSAALFTAACSTSDGPSKINAPDAVSADFGVATAGTITVCIDPTSTAGSYT